MVSLSSLLLTNARILAFRASADEFHSLGRPHLLLGLLWTWLAGMGRYWDHPNPHLLQSLGVGSLVYVGVLSGFLWAVLWPLRPARHSFPRLLAFVCLVSPPAFLYAVPVERFLSLDGATLANITFLGVVALWRLALLLQFIRISGGLTWFRTGVAGLLPMMLIVAALVFLNLEKAVFNIMGGLVNRTANDGAYLVLVGITFLSVYAFPAFLLTYGVMAYRTWKGRGPVSSAGA